MKKTITTFLLISLFTPAFAAAESRFGIEPTLGQLLSRLAAIQALEQGTSLNCAVAATKSTVFAGEAFTIGWGSYGAGAHYSNDPENAYPDNGQQAMQIDKPEVRTYQFSFFGPNGTKTTCDQTITVVARSLAVLQ